MKQRKGYVLFIYSFIFMIFFTFSTAFAQESVVINFDTKENNLGFIYFDYNPVINATVTNFDSYDQSVMIEAEVTDENNNMIWSDCYSINLPKYKAINFPIQTEISRFGLYTLKLTMNETTSEQEFSISNRPRDGSVSQWCMLNDHTIKGHGIKELDRKMELFYKAGFGGIRQEYLWENFEPALDSFIVPSSTVRIINQLENRNMDIMGIMMGCPRYVSEWGNGVLPVTDDTLKEWSKYAEYTAEQTMGISTYYEIWNEYNMRDGAEPENYIKLLQASYSSLHKNPNAVVCGFAAANIGENQEKYPYSVLEWIEKVLQGGGGEYMDAVSIHCYTNRSPEDDLSTLSSGKTWLIDETRAILDKYGYTDMPIIVSEMGWSTGNTAHTDIEKAQYMIRYSAMNYGKIERLYWYVSQDKQNYDEYGNLDMYENGLGVLNTWDTNTGCTNPYGAKSAFLALANFNAMMNGAVNMQECSSEAGVYQYKFKDRYGNDLYIAWSTKDEDAIIEVDSKGDCVTVYDLYGNVIKCETNESIVSVSLSESPVYIKVSEEYENIAEYFPEISVNYDTGEVTISGISAYGAKGATLSVIKKDASAITPLEIAYLGQSETDSNGAYRFSFVLSDIDGLYTTKIGFFGLDQTQQKDIAFDIAIPTLTIMSKGLTVKNLTQIVSGDEISIKLTGIRNLTAGAKTSLMAAIYNQNELKSVEMKDIKSDSTSAEFQFSIKDISKVDKIKVFFWKQGTLQPFKKAYEINK